MEKDEALKRTDHYRCRLCGSISPITETVCTKSSCRAQLAIYGELIMPENKVKADNTFNEESSQKSKTSRKSNSEEIQKLRKEKKQPQKKIPKQKSKPFVQVETQADGSYMTKKKFLTWVDVVFLMVYSTVAYCAEWTDWPYDIADAFSCIAIMLAGTALSIVFAQKRKYVLHGIMCVLNGALSFVTAGGILAPDGGTAFMFLAMVAAYGWLGVISFIGASRKRIVEGSADAFLKKETLMINLDIVIFVLCGALACFSVGLYNMFLMGRYRIYLEDCIIPCASQLAVTALSIVLAHKGKYVLRGILQCAIGAGGLFLVFVNSNLLMDIVMGITVAALRIWLGGMSFPGGTPSKAKPDSGNRMNRTSFWMLLTYFFCIPAGFVVTIVRIFKFYSNDPSVVNRVTKILSVIGVIAGVVIYIYAIANYSHCDEAMYTSIIGLLTKLVIGDL